MRKYFGSALLLLMLCIFFAWFIPLWYDGITRTRQSQMCRLNKSASQWEFDGKIKSYAPSKSNGGYIDFELASGETFSMMEWVFIPQLDTIVPGDRILKVKGNLFIDVMANNKNLRFSLDHGCPEWSSVR
ncbi:hypothetical protein FUA23_18530 [Neolewinella aurantiaca]|uniref:Uncharacterized protein n=1 Tax=Neolewinella aurantiaca TaxID=2602767 RepID=A0A5C7FAC3_9BACT|nr:hypothetical protein [Neolewinella aurantiaca]TXF87582.1 hypothetical protein FUA23_18530 [Neolewinella aurantiaca]